MDFLDNLTSRPEPRFETDFNRPLTSVIDNANNVIEMAPRVKEKTEQKADINLSEQLAKLFPDVDEKITDKNDQSINQLRLSDLSETLSKIDKDEVPKQLEFFEGGISREFETNVQSIGLSSDSIEFLDFLQSDVCEDLLKNNKLKIHVESKNIYHDNNDTNKSLYLFFQQQEDQTKKWVDYEFILDESYEDFFMKYLVNINQNEDQKYDILTNKNSKFLFYHFNDYLAHINEPTKPLRHSEIIDDDFALDIMQNKNWQYFIEKLLEICQSNNSGYPCQ